MSVYPAQPQQPAMAIMQWQLALQNSKMLFQQQQVPALSAMPNLYMTSQPRPLQQLAPVNSSAMPNLYMTSQPQPLQQLAPVNSSAMPNWYMTSQPRPLQQLAPVNSLAMPNLYTTSQPRPLQQLAPVNSSAVPNLYMNFQPLQYTHQTQPASANPLAIPNLHVQQINNNFYSIVDCIAGGDNSCNCKVFEAIGPDTKRYAIKCIFLNQFRKEVIDFYFINEMKFLDMLRDETIIVNLFEWEKTDRYIWIVMEKADFDFAKVLKTNNLTEFDIKNYFRQMLYAVKKIHDYEIIHKDLKPANFLVFGKIVKLADFGISKKVKDNNTTCTGFSNTGTLRYMPPEATTTTTTYRASKDFDIWSLGCILYEMIFQRWYRHPTISSHKHALEIGQNLQQIDPAYKTVYDPKMLIDFLSCCLQYDRRKRSTAEELLNHDYLK